QRIFSILHAPTPREKHRGYPERLEQLPERQVMLVGENLRGRHERRLVAGAHGMEHGQQRDDGLSGADVALNQPVHRMGAAEIAPAGGKCRCRKARLKSINCRRRTISCGKSSTAPSAYSSMTIFMMARNRSLTMPRVFVSRPW